MFFLLPFYFLAVVVQKITRVGHQRRAFDAFGSWLYVQPASITRHLQHFILISEPLSSILIKTTNGLERNYKASTI
jgi:hypothetical protein